MLTVVDNASFWGVFWIDASNETGATRDFVALATTLGASAGSVNEACRLLANTKEGWLLILDNADNPTFDYQVYFPSGTHGTVLMTSRNPECGEYGTIGHEQLNGPYDKDSVILLLKAAKIAPSSWPECDTHATKVVNDLGSHTLALIQAGAHIARGHCSLEQYPEVYRKQRR